MHTLLLCLLCVLLSFSLTHGYLYAIQLDPSGHYKFQWSVDYQRKTIQVKLTAKVTASTWFAVGFSDYGDVTSADLVVFWTDLHNNHHFLDAHTDALGLLKEDPQQDYHVTAVSAEGANVVLEYYRLINTCDNNDYQLDNGTTHVIYVVGDSRDMWSTVPLGADVTRLDHGLQRTQILKPEVAEAKFPSDTWTFEVKAPEILVPSEETTYWWHTTILPRMLETLHIIKYEGVIAEGSEDLVHHMEVFHCQLPAGGRIPYYSGPGVTEGTPKGLSACRRVIGAWAMGAQAMVYPEEAGVPIGGTEYSPFALLEIHYNNPQRKHGRMDSSGVRFYVTSQLRPYAAAIMELGLEYTAKMAVPPGQAAFSLTGYCVEDCTRKGLPDKGIQVFASQLHTHRTGRKVYTTHQRAGQALPDLNRDDHYSSHFQEIRRLPQAVQVLRGDVLITTCVYDTSDRSKATVGGYSILEEMCVNYIHYYPQTDLEVCKSSVETDALHAFFYFMNRMEGMKTSEVYSDRTNFDHISWNSANTQLLSQLYETSPLSMQCNRSDGSRFPGLWDHVPLPSGVETSVLSHVGQDSCE